MKNFTVILVIVFSFITGIKAQENLKKLRIGLTISLENNISSKNMAFDQYTGYFAEYKKINYRFGLNFESKLKKNISINTAINYSNKDFIGTYYCVVCSFITPPSPQEIDFRFVEVPLTLKYYFLLNKFQLFVEFGLNNLFSLNKEVTDNSYGLAIKLGGGIEYNLSKKIALQMILDYNDGISKLYKESDFKLKSLGIGIGIVKTLDNKKLN